MNTQDILSELTDPLRSEILNRLEIIDLLSLSCVSRFWYRCVEFHERWQHMMEEYEVEKSLPTTTGMSWKQLFFYYHRHTNLLRPNQSRLPFLALLERAFYDLFYQSSNKIMILGLGGHVYAEYSLRGLKITDTVPYPSPPNYTLHDGTILLGTFTPNWKNEAKKIKNFVYIISSDSELNRAKDDVNELVKTLPDNCNLLICIPHQMPFHRVMNCLSLWTKLKKCSAWTIHKINVSDEHSADDLRNGLYWLKSCQ